tara:strand:- start:1776 stop:2786 length:1011 start_codon:yes stop_codon:yes gene_type:complete
MTKTILLTGGTGYIGSHTYVELIEAGFDVVILDDFSNSDSSVLQRLGQITGENRVTFYEGSVLDQTLLSSVFAEHKFEAVMHFAALKSIGESVAKPIDYLETNISGLIVLLQAMKAAGVARLVFSSSATVYGDSDIMPIPETAGLKFKNPYAFTKVVSEQILDQAASSYPWSFGVLRYFNPAGAHPSGLIGEDPSDIPNNLIPYISKVATGELEWLNVFGDDYDTKDGTGERDYIHVCDLARGHVLSLKHLIATQACHVVNLGTGHAYSVMEIISAYSKACGQELSYKIASRRHGDVALCVADTTKAKDILGFEAQLDLDEICRSSWSWIQNKSNM